MREYRWTKGAWITDGHLWAMLHDIPKLPREDTGERVVLQPPKWILWDVPPVECKIFYLPDLHIYIAFCENAFRDVPVLFFDIITYKAEFLKRYPAEWWDDSNEE